MNTGNTDSSVRGLTQPLVSIIIAAYNAEADLPDCLESIANQSCKEIEVVVVDGASTDGTLAILKEKSFPLLNWISERDKGIYDALNKGVKLAKGRWLYFMGTDDRLLPGFSQLVAKLMDENTVYYGNSNPKELLLQGRFSSYRLAKYCMNHQSIIYPAAVFDRYHYNLKYRVLADYALNLQVWGDRTFTKKHYPISIVTYNMNGYSAQKKDEGFLQDRSVLIRKHLGWLVYLRYLLKKFKVRKIHGGIDPGYVDRGV